MWYREGGKNSYNSNVNLNLPQGDDDELSVLGSLFDVVGHNGNVLEVQGSVNLVHDVERCWLVVMESEDQGERGESLLSSREIGDVLPGLLGRPHTEHYSFSEWIETVHQLELSVSS